MPTPARTETPTTAAAAMPIIPAVLTPPEGAAVADAEALAKEAVALSIGATERNVVVTKVVERSVDFAGVVWIQRRYHQMSSQQENKNVTNHYNCRFGSSRCYRSRRR